MLVGAVCMLLPMLVGFCYGEYNVTAYLVPVAILCAIGVPCSFIKPRETSIYAKEGFVIVAFCWIILSLVGALPFVISGAIPNYIDAVFETVSGFTTTGATVIPADRIDTLYLTDKGILFWRSFTHFIGGMGVLVFVLALFPAYGEGAMHVYRAESPGPNASKFVSKMKHTAIILYAIYSVMTVILTVLLLFSGMGVYDSVLTAFSTAGTGGFAPHGKSIAYYDSAYVEMVVAIFMFLFGINFNIYYFILVGNVTKIFKNEELRAYFIIVLVAIVIITVNILGVTADFAQALRYSVFQVTSVISTTGFITYDYTMWPSLSQAVIMFIMIVGACGGSTGGGVKVSRLVILWKSGSSDLKKMVHPRAVLTKKLDGEIISPETERNVKTFMVLWLGLIILSTLLLCLDGFASNDLFTHISASVTCFTNTGPGFNLVGPSFDFSGYNGFSKSVLSVMMLAGRLEIFPILILFNPRTWRKSK